MHLFVALSAAFLTGIGSIAAQAVGAPTNAITFQGFPGTKGKYQDVQTFNMKGQCVMAPPKSYTSPISPLDQELSMIFRGPLKLKQFAVYTLGGGQQKRDLPPSDNHKGRNNHQRFHESRKHSRDVKEEKRGYGAPVTATIDGKVVTFTDTWDKPAAATPAAQPNPASPPVQGGQVAPAALATPKGPAPSAAPPVKVSPGYWGRVAYYDAASGTAQGLTFLGNHNWQQSQDGVLGDLIGYLNKAGTGKSDSPAILEDTLIPDYTEFVISSDKKCGAECFQAPGAIAYHGWAGANKMFVAEFQMPLSGQRNQMNADMPAWWALNSKVVNFQQYGCSCWASGCGEWDIHEVNAEGMLFGNASMHMGANYAGTAPNPLARPVGKTMKLAAIVLNDVAHIQVLDDNTKFDTSFLGSTIASFLNGPKAVYEVNTHPF